MRKKNLGIKTVFSFLALTATQIAWAACGSIPTGFSTFVGNTLTIGNGAEINGNNISSGSYLLDRAVNTDGSITQEITTLTDLTPTPFPISATQDVTVADSPLGPGTYDEVTVTSGSTFEFSGGDYYINSITTNANGTLRFGPGKYFVNNMTLGSNNEIEVTSGTVQLYINSSFTSNPGLEANLAGSAGDFLMFFYNAASATMGANTEFNGVMYSPYFANFIFGSNLEFSGVLVTDGTVQMGNNAEITFDATVQAEVSGSSSCPLPDAATPDTNFRMESILVTLPDTYVAPQWLTVNFTQTFDVIPVVFTLLPEQGSHSANLRIRNVTLNGFEMAVTEPEAWDGPHISNSFEYLAVEPGYHQLENGAIFEVGTVDISNEVWGSGGTEFGSWSTLNFTHTYTDPIMLVDVQTLNNETNNPPVTTSEPFLTGALRNVAASSAQIALERSEAQAFGTVSADESVGYLVIENNTNDLFRVLGNFAIDVRSLRNSNQIDGWDDGCDKANFGFTFTNPVVIAKKNTRNVADGGWLRRCAQYNDGVGLTIDEDTAQDNERNHLPVEDIGILVFDGTFTYNTDVTPPAPVSYSVFEVGTATIPANSYTTITFDQSYPDIPAVFILEDYNNSADPSSVRIRNVTANGFEVIPVEPDDVSSDQPDLDTTVNYLVINYGIHTFPGGEVLEVGKIPLRVQISKFLLSSTQTINFVTTFTGTPVVLAEIQTMENELNFIPGSVSTPWMTPLVYNQSTTDMEMSLERSETTSGTISELEQVSYLATNEQTLADLYDLSGTQVPAEANYTTDNIVGTPSCSNVNFLQSYSGSPLVVGNKSKRDGADGGWLRRCSTSPSQAALILEEDTATDTERAHTTEAASIMVFDQAITFDATRELFYRFENSVPGQITDLSGNGFHGNPQNAPVIEGINPAYTSGANSTCQYITADGVDDYVDISNQPQFETGSFTWMAWLLADNSNTDQVVFSHDLTSTTGAALYLNSSNQWAFHTDGAGATHTTPVAAHSNNTWQHVAIVFDATSNADLGGGNTQYTGDKSIYINGVLQSTVTGISYTVGPSGAMRLFASTGTASNFFTGSMDEMQWYGRALAAKDITREFGRIFPCELLDHFRIEAVDGSDSAVNCEAKQIRITAMSNPTTVYTGFAGTINISTSTGNGDWSTNTGTNATVNGTADDGIATYTFDPADSGVVILDLDYHHIETMNINVSYTTKSEDAGYDPNINFAASAFVWVDDDSDPLTSGSSDVPFLTAGTDESNVYLRAITTDPATGQCTGLFANGADVSIDLNSTCLDPNTCIVGQQVAVTNNSNTVNIANPQNLYLGTQSWTPVTLRFGANATAQLTLNYPDVGSKQFNAQYELRDDDNNLVETVTGNTTLVSRPASLVYTAITNQGGTDITGATSSSATTLNAGSATNGDRFRVTVESRNASGTATPNFGNENTIEDLDFTVLSFEPATGVAGTLQKSTSMVRVGAGQLGFAASQGVAYSEVGTLQLSAALADSDYLGTGDISVTPLGSSIGRFVPSYFNLTALAPSLTNACTSFTYQGENFAFNSADILRLAARNADDVVTQNYEGSYNKLLTSGTYTLSETNGNGSGGFNFDGNAQSWSVLNGLATFSLADTLSFTKDTLPEANFNTDLTFTATAANNVLADSDGVCYKANIADASCGDYNQNGIAGNTQYYGRVALENAYGAEIRDLDMVVTLQYWDGAFWQTNTADNCTTLVSGDFSQSAWTIYSGTPSTTHTWGGFTNGVGTLNLSAPGAGNTGTLSISLTPPAHLTYDWDDTTGGMENPQSEAAFGIYEGRGPIIYREQNFR